MKMRTGFALTAALAALTLDCVAQKPQIGLDVRKKQDTDTQQKASRSSLTKDQGRTLELTMTIRNNDPKEQTLKLAWFFVGNPQLAGLDNFVYDKGEQEVKVGPRTVTNVVQASKELGSTLHSSRHKVTKGGAKPFGYIVTVSQDTNLLAVSTSPMSLDKVARDPKAMAALLAAPAPP